MMPLGGPFGFNNPFAPTDEWIMRIARERARNGAAQAMGVTRAEYDRLCVLGNLVDGGVYWEDRQTANLPRLLFYRWLVAHGRLSEFPDSGAEMGQRGPRRIRLVPLYDWPESRVS